MDDLYRALAAYLDSPVNDSADRLSDLIEVFDAVEYDSLSVAQ